MFAQVVARFFGRRVPRLRARSYLLGLLGRLSGLERKNGWSPAEFAGDATPDGMQRLLDHARWDADQVRDALRWQVAGRLGSAGGVLVIDDTGFEKKGRRSAGVQRRYTGTAGKVTDCPAARCSHGGASGYSYALLTALMSMAETLRTRAVSRRHSHRSSPPTTPNTRYDHNRGVLAGGPG